MIVELINTGSELLLGRVLNSHQQWLCRRLADAGYVVSRQTAVPDTANEIQMAVHESLSRASLVITTGGLGPTSDDQTRGAIAQMLGRPMYEDREVLARIESFFARSNRALPDPVRAEAQVPEGAIVLPNLNGTSPGLAIEIPAGSSLAGIGGSWLIMLPGPPRELHPMFTESALPLICRVLPVKQTFVCRTLRTNGIGESLVQERIEKEIQPLIEAGLELGYCARPGQVDVRLAARCDQANELIETAETCLRMKMGECIYGENDEAIEELIVRMLFARKETLVLAESCTGGCLSDRLTNVPGASAVLKGGFVSYSNEMKIGCLGVRSETLSHHGAVSEAVAREMAEGARRIAASDHALAVTGIAGPSGGTDEKPVGTVFIALAASETTQVWRMFNPWDRKTFKEVTTQQALNFLRLRLSK
jgi:nicotinamide-nucleotide amidase